MNRIDRRTYLTLVAGTTLGVAGCASVRDDEPSGESQHDGERVTAKADAADSETAASSESSPDFALGDRLEVGDLSVVVAELDLVDEVPVGPTDPLVETDDGAVFAVVDIAMQNGDDDTIAVDDVVSVQFTGEGGEAYDPVDALEAADDGEDGPVALEESRLAPSEVVRGDLVYEVERDVAGAVLELAAVSGGETARVDLETTADSSEALEYGFSEDVYGFSEGVDVGGIEITVSSLEHGNNLGGFMQSDEGQEIVAIGVTIENGSGRDRTLSPEQVQLKDETGRVHDEAPGVLRALERFDGTVLADGEAHEAKIAYQIEDGLQELYWLFDAEVWDENRRVCWQLR